jgi:hypothetical protein
MPVDDDDDDGVIKRGGKQSISVCSRFDHHEEELRKKLTNYQIELFIYYE